MENMPNMPVSEERVREAEKTLLAYRAAKAPLEARLIENEQWYRLRHLSHLRENGNINDPEPASAWLLNCILNKHADAMDNYPEPYVLPREESDAPDAEALSAVLPVILEQNDYEKVYSDVWWAKLKGGTGVTGVFWNPRKLNGLGDVDVRKVDLLNLYWEPGVSDIQASRNVFHIEQVDNDLLEERWPFLKGKLTGGALRATRHINAPNEEKPKSVVVDWYYKRARGARDILHFAKFVCGQLIYASEHDPLCAERGFYDHGKYPFVMDAQFIEEDSPAGFGYIDVCKQPQMFIDKLNQVILKQAVMAARPRFFIRSDGAINEQEYADWSRDFVHYQGGSAPSESLKQIELKPLDASVVAVLKHKIDELKETGGNRDISQGAPMGGVVAASAIAALQESSGKLSRDMLKSTYRAFTHICYLCLELVRQFYDEPRCFRILGGDMGARYMRYDNSRIRPLAQEGDFGLDMGARLPIFDVCVRPQRRAPSTMTARNELAREFYALGFFNPVNAEQALACIDMMEFEGKPQLIRRIQQGDTARKETDKLKAQMLRMAQILDAQNGTAITQAMQSEFGDSA